MNNKAKWIWYPGDYEIHHHLKLNLRREERGFQWPAYWKLDDCCHSIRFRREITINQEEVITAYAHEVGYIAVDGRKYAFGTKIKIGPGTHLIEAVTASIQGLPCLFVEGNEINSDENWKVDDYSNNWLKVGSSNAYTKYDSDPEIFPFQLEQITLVDVKVISGNMLYDFGKQTFASLLFNEIKRPITIYYGESEIEALEIENTYLWEAIEPQDKPYCCVPRAFRYLYIKGEEQDFTVWYELLGLETKAEFSSDDELINQIWDTAEYTFALNCREFYLDGIKRDRWVWSGDAYQSIYINHYLFFDPEITKRTLIGLRGKDPIASHINTIVDYSFYWIISIGLYYEATKDTSFIEFIYPRMKTLMEYCIARTDDDMWMRGKENDWIFIDWAEIDKTGAVCAEQMLYCEALRIISKIEALLGMKSIEHTRRYQWMKNEINNKYWDEEKGAYIDSFESGKRNVTRHANIFAIRFGFADENKRSSIIKNVILNDQIPQIITPFFKFFELEAMCEIGQFNYVTDQMKSYWGSMLKIGATTFWEEFDPSVTGKEKYSMYGDPFGKSLCHAWGASPIYLLGRFYFGVAPTSAGYDTFKISPNLGGLKRLKGKMPVKDGEIILEMDEETVTVCTNKVGGTLVVKGMEYQLEPNVVCRIDLI
ncbi:hypothetical protein HNQ56_001399 [Anaerotaenia torta]|uniref:alpha-L-rhamnosidase-related protein n=1 Tax=Anaerotaenia torta TaxID=433293 RepID=UPI003D19B367